MRGDRLAVLVLVAPLLAGCSSPAGAGPCAAPDDGETWPDRWATGATLVTRRTGERIDAWGCNVSAAPLWILRDVHGCRGAWTWEAESASGPPGHYGEAVCGGDDVWLRLDPGEGVHRSFAVVGSPGDGFVVRFMVYMQPELLTDAGGGDLRADLTV